MGSVWGNKLKLSIFGESHGEGIGVVIDGFPAGFAVDFEYINRQMKRRAPGGSLATARKESDEAQILSGIKGDFTTGAPICAFIKNNDMRSSDYQSELINPRPSHADYTAHIKYNGFADLRGGGHLSARLTAPFVFAGALCADYLKREYNITIAARIKRVGHIEDDGLDYAVIDASVVDKLNTSELPMLNEKKAEEVRDFLAQLKSEGDSVGAIVECFVLNAPVGLGEHIFSSAEAIISSAVFGIPGVKGIEFGRGFELATMRGSDANDGFYYDSDGQVRVRKNNNGGILGGMTSGMPVVFSVAFKPTPSIFIEQETVNLRDKTNENFTIKGRHDPCIGLRAVPIVEAAAAVAFMEMTKG